ncbi:MAG: HNH endonuclease [Akkermansiaceae bacterium]|nr:HNH endonuclease [Armatimonadota bacterium]
MAVLRKQKTIRDAVSLRAGARCEYCKSPSDIGSAPFNVEHIEPTVGGGADEVDNLAWSCVFCNASKAKVTKATDPATGDEVALFHPRHNEWTEHFAWDDIDDSVVRGRTAIGRATENRLKLNREEIVNFRRLLRSIGRHPPLDTVPTDAIT